LQLVTCRGWSPGHHRARRPVRHGFWEDYADGKEPYFSVPATGIEDLNDPIRKWPFNDPDYNLFPVLNLAVGRSGGGDPAAGSYPAEMLIDWVRVF
jgi:hypothetical protein